MTLDRYRSANLASWNEAVCTHDGAEFYDVQGFRDGACTLSAIERRELAPFVGQGTTLLHLQCHFGLDTLSWARRGAVVTGVDFSAEAIAVARSLADEVGLSKRATFHENDLYDLPGVLRGEFDVVFTSWGVLMWLDDLERWADIVAGSLRPGGTFCLCELRPCVFLIAEDASADSLRIGYPSFQEGVPVRFDAGCDYADPTARLESRVTYEWTHGFAEIIDPLLRAGLRLDSFRESPSAIRGLPMSFLDRR